MLCAVGTLYTVSPGKHLAAQSRTDGVLPQELQLLRAFESVNLNLMPEERV